MKKSSYFIVFLLFILVFAVAALFQIPDKNLHIIVCNVGQGDAILFVYKKVQILTDGGPDKKVLGCLGRHVPFWDRNIELVISTHPDADHSSGLIDVLERFKVANILINPIDPGTQTFRLLEKLIGSRGIRVLNPRVETKLRVGLISLDIVYPTKSKIMDLTQKTSDSLLNFYKPVDATNTYSISYILSLGKFKGLFTGDISPEVSGDLVSQSILDKVEYIKVPHHGSKNGLTSILLEKTRPKIGVISVGKHNLFGHPAPVTLNLLKQFNVKIYRTDLDGDIEFVTDGEKIWKTR